MVHPPPIHPSIQLPQISVIPHPSFQQFNYTPIHLYVCPSTHLPTYPSIHLPINTTAPKPTYSLIHSFKNSTTHPSIPYIYPQLHCPSNNSSFGPSPTYPPIKLFIHPSFHPLSICPSIYSPTYLSNYLRFTNSTHLYFQQYNTHPSTHPFVFSHTFYPLLHPFNQQTEFSPGTPRQLEETNVGTKNLTVSVQG